MWTPVVDENPGFEACPPPFTYNKHFHFSILDTSSARRDERTANGVLVEPTICSFEILYDETSPTTNFIN